MKRKRFTDEQIIGILKEHEAGTPVSELCRKLNVQYKTACVLLQKLREAVGN